MSHVILLENKCLVYICFLTKWLVWVNVEVFEKFKTTLFVKNFLIKVPLHRVLQRLQQDLPDSILHQIPDCGHLPHVEKPDITAQTILNFIQSEGLC